VSSFGPSLFLEHMPTYRAPRSHRCIPKACTNHSHVFPSSPPKSAGTKRSDARAFGHLTFSRRWNSGSSLLLHLRHVRLQRQPYGARSSGSQAWLAPQHHELPHALIHPRCSTRRKCNCGRLEPHFKFSNIDSLLASD